MNIIELPPEQNDFKVLVIDDEPAVRKICEYTLKQAGFELFMAENGLAGIELLRNHPEVDIILSDIKMPIMNGMDVLTEVKQNWPHIEVIIMTGFATIENAIKAMKDGAHDFILKPLKPGQIRLALNRCVANIQLNKENKELKERNKQLLELREIKDKFLAITSHELRTPVTHLKGYFAILNDDYFDEISQEERESCISVIKSALKDLEELVNKMFDVVNLKRYANILVSENIDIVSLLESIEKEFAFILKDRNLIFKLITNSQYSPISADRLKLKGLFSELITNAIKFTPDGGSITISVEEDMEFLKIAVEDTGIGIPQNEFGKIFEPFYEVQNSDYHSTGKTTFMGGGLAIGLSLAREIVVAHGGMIRVESIERKGSRFIVFLPKRQALQ